MVRVTFSQSGGIYNSYSTVARDLWRRKPPLSSGYALGLGSVYCHKSLAPCYNYNIEHTHTHTFSQQSTHNTYFLFSNSKLRQLSPSPSSELSLSLSLNFNRFLLHWERNYCNIIIKVYVQLMLTIKPWWTVTPLNTIRQTTHSCSPVPTPAF